jgi:hypothetical protein
MAFRSVRRRVSLVVVSAALAVSTFGVGSSGAATRATAALPVVKVSPSTGLVDLQNVTVRGSGFSANVQIGTVECRPGAKGEADCDLGTLVYVQSDQHGTFTLSRYVRRLFSVGGKTIDCGAAKGCIVGAGNVLNLKQANGQTIFFNPKIPPKVPTMTVSPNTKLADHQLVTVTGNGFAPSTSVYLSQCITHPTSATNGPLCDYATQRYATVGSNGTFTAANFVLERHQLIFTKKNTQTFLDCAAKPDTCEIQAGASGLGSLTPVNAPLTFGLYIKPAVAAVQLSPSSPLDDLESVTLTGTGYTPGVGVNVQECTLGTAKVPNCDFTTNRTITAGFTGEFTVTYTVRRDISAFVSPTGPANVDCATNACELLVQGSQSQPPDTLPLTFDPNVPAVTPTITAVPNSGLTDNQQITVALSGFTPNQPVQIIECASDAITETNLGYCDYTTGQSVTPSGPTTVQASFVVRAVLGGQGGLTDCTTQPGECVLVASENGGYYGGGGIIVGGPALANVASTPLAFMKP